MGVSAGGVLSDQMFQIAVISEFRYVSKFGWDAFSDVGD